MVTANFPQYELFCQATTDEEGGRWRFYLRRTDGSESFSADGQEWDVHPERLQLLAVVRGLEALDQPSAVTLTSPSRYVARGICDALEDWRRNGWTWECYGRMVPIKNRDLWQRLDRALKFHRIECSQRGATVRASDVPGRRLRLDNPHRASAPRPRMLDHTRRRTARLPYGEMGSHDAAGREAEQEPATPDAAERQGRQLRIRRRGNRLLKRLHAAGLWLVAAMMSLFMTA